VRVEDLSDLCAARRRWYAENNMTGEPGMLLTIPRPPGRGERMRVFPGVLGEVGCWNGTSTVVRVLVRDVERAIAAAQKAREEGK